MLGSRRADHGRRHAWVPNWEHVHQALNRRLLEVGLAAREQSNPDNGQITAPPIIRAAPRLRVPLTRRRGWVARGSETRVRADAEPPPTRRETDR